ncbi:hypothetical protein KAI87_07680 [Myxococcota bacterium]|nr:hypothetical protein [Myxococcota bacterium]
MKINHGGLEIDIPETWFDQSTLMFVGPVAQESASPTAKKMTRAPESVTVQFLAGTDEDDIESMLRFGVAGMQAFDPAYEDLRRFTMQTGLGEAQGVERKLSLGGMELRQIVVAAPFGGAYIVASATAAEASFDFQKKELERILASLSLS